MKVYLVIERYNPDPYNDNVYGVFTDEKKAMQVKNDVMVNYEQHDERSHVTVMELCLNEVTEDYEFIMNS